MGKGGAHEEESVSQEATERLQELSRLLAQEQAAYRDLEASAVALRKALVHGEQSVLEPRVHEQRTLLGRLTRLHRHCTHLCRAAGWIGAQDTLRLPRLMALPAVHAEPHLREQCERVQVWAARAAREMAHNRHLIGRLAQWSRQELRLILEPLTQAAGYSATGGGRRSSPGPALVDRHG
jgi:flagellar biosynthesis/type III secretory pathway chaperone